MKTAVLQIQRITLTSQDTIRELEDRQRVLQHDFQHAQQSLQQTHTYLKRREADTNASVMEMQTEQRQNFADLQASLTTSMQPLLSHMEQMTLASNQQSLVCQPSAGNAPFAVQGKGTNRISSAVRISATIDSQQCPWGCRCQCHARSSIHTPQWLRSVFGQLLWSYNSSISIRSCNHPPCRKSWGKQHFTYYFPSWLVSRAFVASADLDGLFNAGAKISINMPLIVPEESHIVWSLVIAGNLEQLRYLVSSNRNLMYVRNQWGQSILHVSTTSMSV